MRKACLMRRARPPRTRGCRCPAGGMRWRWWRRPTEVPQSCSPNNPYRVDATGPVSERQPHGREAVGARLRRTTCTCGTTRCPASTRPTRCSAPTPRPASTHRSTTTSMRCSRRRSRRRASSRTNSASPTPRGCGTSCSTAARSAGWGIEWHFDTFTTTSISGVKIAYVHAGSPAAAAGFQRGDVLTSIGGLPASGQHRQCGRRAAGALVPGRRPAISVRASAAAAARSTARSRRAGHADVDRPQHPDRRRRRRSATCCSTTTC